MKISKSLIAFYLLLLIIFGCSSNKKSTGQINASPLSTELYNTIAYLDSALFDAFNKGDISVLQTFLSEELEFYHDLGGVTNYNQNIEAFKKTFTSDRKLKIGRASCRERV